MSQPGSAADSRTVRRTVHRCSRSRGIWAIGSTGSSNTVGARAQRELEALYCVACCWGLTALLFFGGVMNLYWIGGLALFVLLEKTVPPGHWLASLSGLGLVGWGVALLAVAVLS